MSYLRINTRVFDKNKEEAVKFYRVESGESEDSDAQFDTDIEIDTVEFNKYENSLKCFYSRKVKDEDLMSSDISIPLEMDLVIEIIEYYRKKLGKLKTVFEATKDEEGS